MSPIIQKPWNMLSDRQKTLKLPFWSFDFCKAYCGLPVLSTSKKTLYPDTPMECGNIFLDPWLFVFLRIQTDSAHNDLQAHTCARLWRFWIIRWNLIYSVLAATGRGYMSGTQSMVFSIFIQGYRLLFEETSRTVIHHVHCPVGRPDNYVYLTSWYLRIPSQCDR